MAKKRTEIARPIRFFSTLLGTPEARRRGAGEKLQAWQSGTFKKSSERIGKAMHLTTDAGKTYYMRLNFSYQRMHLELSDETEGHFLIGSSLATSQPKKK
jgi:hypothetical protein